MVTSKLFRLFFYCSLSAVIFISCKEKNNQAEVYSSMFESTKYSGMNTCKDCHADKYETFIHTGMGLSIDTASKKKTSAEFSGHTVSDKFSNLNYYPHWKGDSLFVTEFRIENRDTIYKRTENISWIVGSGQHTNSHLVNFNGYIYQAPVTFYTQEKKWDLPPGFENGHNTRFSRMIGLECMSCHNSYPDFVKGSENKYKSIPNGIDCERCHGPGSAHVMDKLAGKTIDINTHIDYSIVNPSKLPIDLQLDVCQRCHIQGNAVLKDNRSFMDFRPGMSLSSVMDVYMPLFKGDDQSHIMASHAERMKMSKCFIVSSERAEKLHKEKPSLKPYKNAMTCITCHDPHVTVKNVNNDAFNSKCKSCHYSGKESPTNNNLFAGNKSCTAPMEKRMLVLDNCVKCHMPGNNTIDIPHVTATDHWIRKPVDNSSLNKIKEFAGLACINNPYPDNRSKGKAFLSYYEKFSPNIFYLDSAKRYFSDVNPDSIINNLSELIHWAYLKEDYQMVINYVKSSLGILKRLNKMDFTNDDAWTAYRIGESYYAMGDIKNSLMFFQKSVDLAPYQLQFRNKLAGAQHDAGLIEEARKTYQFIINENPKFPGVYINYGFLILTADKNPGMANAMYDKALELDPDNIQALFNKAGVLIYLGRKSEARSFLKEIIKRDKNNAKANQLLNQMK